MLIDNEIDIIINQSGHLIEPINIARSATKGLDISIISVYHNMPGIVLKTISSKKNRIRKIISDFKARYSMHKVYNLSDKYVLLSKSYIKSFRNYALISNNDKLTCISNPITVLGGDYNIFNKIKEIIYVGRVDYNQKRVYRVIDTWRQLEDKFPEWTLTIVGDGPELNNIKKQVEEYGLKRVSFEGFQSPLKYYNRASLLIMTSEYEGFSLTIVEAMYFGTVPIIYNSCPAFKDFINNGKNGILVPYNSKGFDSLAMAEALSTIMDDSSKRKELSKRAKVDVNKFSVELISSEWYNLLNKYIKC